MKKNKQKNTLTVSLSSACTIAEVEADFDTIRSLPEEIETINIKAGAVEEVDTAYLQLLLSIKQTAQERGILFRVKEASDEISDICSLYGVEFN